MGCIHDVKWKTKDGREMYLFEMTDGHLANAKAFIERRLANKEYNLPHDCGFVDILDGPCYDCHANEDRLAHWEQLVKAFELEMRRRAADAARAVTAKP